MVFYMYAREEKDGGKICTLELTVGGSASSGSQTARVLLYS